MQLKCGEEVYGKKGGQAAESGRINLHAFVLESETPRQDGCRRVNRLIWMSPCRIGREKQ
jgi:hypothetical protein